MEIEVYHHKGTEYFIVVLNDDLCAYIGYEGDNPYDLPIDAIDKYMRGDIKALRSGVWGAPING